MTYGRGLLQEAAVVATSPITGPAPTDGVSNQLATSGGSAPDSASDSSSTSLFYVNSQFSPTMIIILVILLSAFLFMALFAVYVRRCTSEEGLSQRGSSRFRSRRDDSNRVSDVDPVVVESYPIVSYAAAKKKGCYECPVCLAEFEGADELKQLPKCKHVFHPGCIGLWLESHTTCPLCRRSLVSSDRWSISFRWGGSSRGRSLSARRNGQESSRSRRSGELPSSRFGRAGSSTGPSTGPLGRNEDASSRGCVEHETSLRVIDASASCELEAQGLQTSSLSASNRLSVVPRRLPASPLASEVAPIGRSETILSIPSPQASSFSSDLMPHEIQECPVSSEHMPRGDRLSEVAPRRQHASPLSAELATNASSELAKSEVRKPRQAAVVQGRRRLSRSNSTGHSLRRRAVLQATGCMPFSLHRSRSMGVEGLEEEEEGIVGPACSTSEHSPVSGSGCSSQIPREPCHDSMAASATP